MSEYQFVHFLAIDKPLTGEQLEFMNRQSSRADISQWEFTNEYHYGSFRGKARFSTWLYRLAYNRTIERRRKAPLRTQHIPWGDLEGPATSSGGRV